MAPGVPRVLLLLLPLLKAPPNTALSALVQAAFLEDNGGSGEMEGSSASSPSLAPPRSPAFSPTSVGPPPTALAGPSPPTNFLDGIVDFFREYMLLISVVGSLAFVLLFIICAAVIVRQKHKASAYYPSSFPKKKYVDQRDRTGGPRAFSEVPDKAPDARPDDPALDSSRQLQADILAATQNLKSPTKGPLANGDGGRAEEREAKEEEEAAQAGEESQGRGTLREKAEAPSGEAAEPSCPVGAEAAAQEPPTGGMDRGEQEGAPSVPQESAASEGPCACSSLSPEA
ncbi:transmembrane protein 119 isoform X2 [Monodelphis domestica]|nr:transmembrane protein 119 isoform X2 [Monodelphis domestica]XP_056677608.1 transmembrane protein 119 isoform X2 [Monodelphis domestica]XP_056677609.1 transmembrane protein 119 isoform X2 [Monodelphis domestica]XP_056677610.1 transmembrane protein 119 isoform X2 [Monodelphis domestica]